MARKWKVVVQGGGSNLYEVSEYEGRFYAYKINVKLLMNDRRSLGKTGRFEEALSLIRMHSGREIKEID